MPRVAADPAPNIIGGADMQRLKLRRDFVAAARGASVAGRSVVVQMRNRGDEGPARVGFTVTRKMGGAVERNRIRRRLKEAVRLALPGRMAAGRDYVVIGRQAAALRPFELLKRDLVDAVGRVETAPKNTRRGRTQGPAGGAARKTGS